MCRSCARGYVADATAALAGGGDGVAAAAGVRCPAAGCGAALSVDLDAPARTPPPAAASTSGPAPPDSAAARLPGTRAGSILRRIRAADFQSSTKIEAVREEIDRMRAADPGAKAVVFSQFTSMLELIAYRLHATGVRSVRLQGGMSMSARARRRSMFSPRTPTFPSCCCR